MNAENEEKVQLESLKEDIQLVFVSLLSLS